MKYYFVTLIILLWFSPQQTSAQTIGVSYAQQWTGHYEVEQPNGYAWRFTWPLDSTFHLKIGLESLRNLRTYTGPLQGGFLQPAVIEEPVLSTTRERNVDVMVQYYWWHTSQGQSWIGGGVRRAVFEVFRESENTHRTKYFTPQVKWGISLEGGLAFPLTHLIPVQVECVVNLQTTGSHESPTDAEFPLSGNFSSIGFQTGVAYVFE